MIFINYKTIQSCATYHTPFLCDSHEQICNLTVEWHIVLYSVLLIAIVRSTFERKIQNICMDKQFRYQTLVILQVTEKAQTYNCKKSFNRAGFKLLFLSCYQ